MARMRENTDQENSEYGHFLRILNHSKLKNISFKFALPLCNN